ncbi:GNAT family N-acetyltransferase [Heyndrickxia oleronia]|uniref:GNAT family N-acetyltransferase n=1 Tax=Heyndrickxia oleronia TaxID=38875 RepID=UPI003F2362CA
MSELAVTRYKPEINFSGFSCGNEKIDHILKNFTSVLHREDKATTNLFYLDGNFVGFCSLFADRISSSQTKIFLNGEYPYYYPAVQLYALGVQKEYQKMGIGSEILQWVISEVFKMKQQIGVSFIVLEAYNEEKLIKFYKKNGFEKWKYLESNDNELVPLVYDFRGLD